MPDTLAWNFRYMAEDAGEYSCTWSALEKYFPQIKALESQTRAEIESHRNSNHGWKKTTEFTREFQDILKNTQCFDDRRVSQIELSGQCRAFGFYTDRNVFNFVFLDENHAAYMCRK